MDLLEDLKISLFFVMIYIIHKMLVLVKNKMNILKIMKILKIIF